MTLAAAVLCCAGTVLGQEAAVKTNLLSDGFFSPNIGVEAGIAPKWTLEAEGQFNTWTLSHGRRWKHWAVQPEARFWPRGRFSGHFVGVHAHGGQFNIGGFDGKINFLGTDARKLEGSRYQGWFLGAGVSYGHAWMIGRHWGMEGEIGLGYSYTRYDRFCRCRYRCNKLLETDKTHNYAGITRLAISLSYVF